jgi:FOG: WD40 repeat
VQTRLSNQSTLLELVQDANRFAQTFASDCISEHPLLVYMSALPFTPTCTTLYKRFQDEGGIPRLRGPIQQYWDPLLMTLVCPEADIRWIAFSPDGKKIAAFGEPRIKSLEGVKGSVHIWGAETGAKISSFSVNGTSALVFSPDGSRIMHNEENDLHVRDVASGREACPPLTGHSGAIVAVIYGLHIVSGSKDGDIRVWDPISGVEIARTHIEDDMGSLHSPILPIHRMRHVVPTRVLSVYCTFRQQRSV